jgi:hypothetical protein
VGNTNVTSLVYGDDVALTKIAMSLFLKIVSSWSWRRSRDGTAIRERPAKVAKAAPVTT